MSFGFAAALGAAAPFIDTAANVGLSIYGMNRQSHENRENYNRQINMFNMTNEYNSPINQMKRYKEAGLNPNLIYGQTNTAQMPNNDSGYFNPNFDKINMFSQALDGYQNRKDAEATLQRIEEQKEYDRKRQAIIDNRQAKAFEMEMKLKQAQIDNIKAKPIIEAQKNQVLAQKEIKRLDNKVINAAHSVRRGLVGYGAFKLARSLSNRAVGVVFPTVSGAITPALALNYGVQKGIIDPLQTQTVGDWFADHIGRPIHRFFKTEKSKRGFYERDGSIVY